MTDLEHALRETLAVADRRRGIRRALRDALRVERETGDARAVVRLAAELVEGDDAESDRADSREHGRASGI